MLELKIRSMEVSRTGFDFIAEPTKENKRLYVRARERFNRYEMKLTNRPKSIQITKKLQKIEVIRVPERKALKGKPQLSDKVLQCVAVVLEERKINKSTRPKYI
jgi:hypothetical protein